MRVLMSSRRRSPPSPRHGGVGARNPPIWESLVGALALATLLLLVGCAAATSREGPEEETVETAASAAVAVPGDWLARAQRGIAEREYRASRNRQGLQAPNRAQNLRTYFEPTGIRVHDRTAAGSPELLALSLAGVGRGEALAEPEPGVVSSEGARVEIRRGALLEWYENSAAGLEQGFTLAERPAGAVPLVLELTVEGATVSRRGDALVFATAAGRKLRYGALRARDAEGAELAARLETTAAGRVRLAVEDALATYPIVVDPLLTQTWDAQLESDQAYASLGGSVAGAGDVNGDGYADILVGAPYYDAGETNEGAAFVFLGSAAGIADGDPLTAHAQLESNQGSAYFGWSVGGAGDVNGDGYADVIVGAYLYDAGETNEGAAFVFLGSAAGIADGNPSTAHAQLESNQATAYFGRSVAGAGDVNGDGYADVIVGAHYYDAGQTDEGAAFVFLGSAAGIADGSPASAAAQLESDQAAAEMGYSVSGAGDVNGDGYDDVIVGAHFYDAGEGRGAAFVFLGSAAGIADGNPTTAATQLESNRPSPQLGYSVAGAGDVNGDGYADVIVGAPRYYYSVAQADEGVAFVFLGSAAGIADGDPSTADAQINSNQFGAELGTSVAGAGDVNGDGYADVIVGAPYYQAGQDEEGAAFVFLGGASGIAGGDPSAAYAQLESDQTQAALGWSVAGAGDVNGDGYADVVVGAYLYDAGESDEGGAFVFLGGAAGIADGSPSTAHAQLESNQAGSRLGASVAGAGDVNGDGYADVIVGAYAYGAGQATEGAAFVFLGNAGGLADGNPATADARLESGQATAQLGLSVAGAGDVNGDGYADVIVGAPYYDGGQTDEGAAFVFLGSAAGIANGDPTTANAQLESNQAAGHLGRAVAGAGDVNGDGYADVIVGAPNCYDAGQGGEGKAFIFLGSATGIADGSPATAATRLDSNQSNAALGWSVAGAGDVNGDGYADVVVGAPTYDAGESGEGAAFVFLGSAAGIPDGNPTTALAQLESDQEGAQFGESVAGAGDVNGDGYADLIIGAPSYDAGQTNEGAAFVFLGHASGVVGRDPPTAHAQLESDQANAYFGYSVAGAGDVNGDGYSDVVVGSHFYDAGEASEGAAFVFLGHAAGMVDGNPATAHAQLESDQAGAFFGISVAGAGDLNGDGYADILVGAYRYDAGEVTEGAAFVFLGNGNRNGYPILPQQLTGSAASAPVPPWGRSLNPDNFQIALTATHPEGRGRVKLELEVCPPDVSFGRPSCISRTSTSWVNVTAPGGAVRLYEVPDGLTDGTLYRWRARVLRAPYTETAPPVPPHGPWRRLNAQAVEADIRALPEPGGLASLLAGVLALALLRRRARRVGAATTSAARLRRARGLAGALMAVSLLLGCGAAPPPEPEQTPETAEAAASAVPGDWLARAQRGIAEREYRASHNRQGLQAPNRAQNLRTYFEPTGIRVHDRTAAGSPQLLALSLAGVGRGEALAEPQPGVVTSEGARVEIRHGALLEWYENSAAGLEQGFTLAERPAGAGPLVLELAVEGATVSRRGDALVFATAAGRELRYGALRARDAAGAELPARLETTAAGRVRLAVEDALATYPIVVDPLLTQTWDAQLESDQAYASLGGSVAGAGDVNGDGYADVVVGALWYDAGEMNEGAAFVFLGGAAGIADGDPGTAAARLESNQVDARLGAAVASAGDVNGDGYADVIVGAPYYDADETNEGAAFVFLGSATGIADGDPSTAHAQLESNQATAYFGVSVASAGDVNGDGYADVIVGAHYYDAGETDAGAAFVFLGSATGIADGNPATAHARLESDQASSFLGTSVARAGDVNGDGYADVIVGAPAYDAGEPDEGAAFVFLGSASGIADGGPTTAASQLESNQANAQLGRSVAGAGDVNGDGYADLIVGAPYYDAGEPDEGAAFVFLGSASGIADADPTTAHAQLESDLANALLGTGASGAGDVNGDGYADVIAGAPYYGAVSTWGGAAFVFLGSASGIADGDPGTAAARLESNQASGQLGWGVAGAGDVNGDGYADVIVGAPNYAAGELGEGAAFVFLGSAAGVADGDPTTAQAQLESNQSGGFLGQSVASAGDVNGDGYGDVIVGAFRYDAGEQNEGAAFVFLGGPAGIASTADAQLESDQMDALLGASVAGAGDVNGDGYGDVIVGAPFYNGGEFSEGAAFVFLGSAAGIADGDPGSAHARIESDQAFARLGLSVSSAGDVNGDGYADVVVGASQYDAGEEDEGAAFVFLGSPLGVVGTSPATAHAQLESNQLFAYFGASVAGAGDVNGDGYGDVIVGAPLYDAGEREEGAAFVFLGSADGIGAGDPGTAFAQLESDQGNAQLGWSVAGAGDVNGDGYGDVIVSALYYDALVTNGGTAFVFLGHALGIVGSDPPTAHAWLESDQPDAGFGQCVAGAGDVNGDGYADVIVGAPYYDAGQADEGAAFVFLGSARGIADAGPDTADARLESDQADARLGVAVAGAGDVNGDGYADVIAGAPRYDAGETTEGAAFAFLGNGGREGRPLRVQQLRGDLSSTPVAPWGGSADEDAFGVEMTATHPAGRGRVKLEVEACPPDVAFGHPSCVSHEGAAWIDATASAGGVRLAETVGGLTSGTLYRWRARVLHAPFTETPPLAPPHGPWHRVNGQVTEADVRVLPEPGVVVSLLAGMLALGLLRRARRAGLG